MSLIIFSALSDTSADASLTAPVASDLTSTPNGEFQDALNAALSDERSTEQSNLAAGTGESAEVTLVEPVHNATSVDSVTTIAVNATTPTDFAEDVVQAEPGPPAARPGEAHIEAPLIDVTLKDIPVQEAPPLVDADSQNETQQNEGQANEIRLNDVLPAESLPSESLPLVNHPLVAGLEASETGHPVKGTPDAVAIASEEAPGQNEQSPGRSDHTADPVNVDAGSAAARKPNLTQDDSAGAETAKSSDPNQKPAHPAVPKPSATAESVRGPGFSDSSRDFRAEPGNEQPAGRLLTPDGLTPDPSSGDAVRPDTLTADTLPADTLTADIVTAFTGQSQQINSLTDVPQAEVAAQSPEHAVHIAPEDSVELKAVGQPERLTAADAPLVTAVTGQSPAAAASVPGFVEGQAASVPRQRINSVESTQTVPAQTVPEIENAIPAPHGPGGSNSESFDLPSKAVPEPLQAPVSGTFPPERELGAQLAKSGEAVVVSQPAVEVREDILPEGLTEQPSDQSAPSAADAKPGFSQTSEIDASPEASRPTGVELNPAQAAVQRRQTGEDADGAEPAAPGVDYDDPTNAVSDSTGGTPAATVTELSGTELFSDLATSPADEPVRIPQPFESGPTRPLESIRSEDTGAGPLDAVNVSGAAGQGTTIQTEVIAGAEASPVQSQELSSDRGVRATLPLVVTLQNRHRSLTDTETQRLQVRLDPPELGRVLIDVSSGEEGLTARISAVDPTARIALAEELPALRSALADAGIDEIDIDLSSDDSAFGQQDADPQGEDFDPRRASFENSSQTTVHSTSVSAADAVVRTNDHIDILA